MLAMALLAPAGFVEGAEPREALLDIGGVGRLADLAVIDDVDPGGDLPTHDLIGRARDRVIEGAAVAKLTALPALQQIDDLGRAPQAAGVGGENSIRAGLPHGKCLRPMTALLYCARSGGAPSHVASGIEMAHPWAKAASMALAG